MPKQIIKIPDSTLNPGGLSRFARVGIDVSGMTTNFAMYRTKGTDRVYPGAVTDRDGDATVLSADEYFTVHIVDAFGEIVETLRSAPEVEVETGVDRG